MQTEARVNEVQNLQPEQIISTELEMRLLNEYQRGLPLSPTPFADMAQHLDTSEAEVLSILGNLQERGAVSRVGPVFKPQRAGASTLAAIAVPPDQLESVAAYISAYKEVNHNYERENHLNLWFVVTASTQERLEEVLAQIGDRWGLPVLNLPLVKHFHIDLGFPL